MQHKITTINYQYRSADNWKIFGQFSLLGEITQEQHDQILQCLEGDAFIPHQVGLPNLALSDDSYKFDLEFDHGLHELSLAQSLDESIRQGRVKIEELHSGADGIPSISEFIGRMSEQESWDAHVEFMRMIQVRLGKE
ncbi:hypothetical protein GP5015_337 [gamma proteobacterium HTCC5015]|nr:hypothetical protein GP5015_337 [gamma proteobacterium HTCC5015]